jgi:hypothetical protein
MLLVQAGNRSVPVVAGTLLSERAAAGLVDVLASIGTEKARQSLVRLSNASAAVTPQCRAAAAEALRTLDEIRRRDDNRS